MVKAYNCLQLNFGPLFVEAKEAVPVGFWSMDSNNFIHNNEEELGQVRLMLSSILILIYWENLWKEG